MKENSKDVVNNKDVVAIMKLMIEILKISNDKMDNLNAKLDLLIKIEELKVKT